MKSFLYIFICTVLSMHASAQSALPKKGEKKLNVLFIAVDDLKPAIGAYGDKLVKTPNIDRLAARGIIFQRNYCQQAICAVSRTSLLSGLRPDRTGVWDLITDFRKVDSTIVSLPQYLASKGYNTQGFGKIFHEGSAAPGHDAKSWTVPYKVVTAPMYATTKPDPNAKRFYAPDTSVVSAKNLRAFLTSTENADVHDTVYRDGKLALRAIDALRSLTKDSKPFFLGVGFIKPHLPFVAPKKYWDLYKREQFSIDPFQQKAANSPDVAYHLSLESKMYTDMPDFDSYSDIPEKHLSAEKQKELLHGYYASISYMDAQVGRLLDELDRLGIANNTVIVLWGDHGWHLGDHGLWNKHTNFEQATRAPLIISSPNTKSGVATNSISEFVDVYPTVVDLLNLPVPADLDGKSLVPVIRNSKVAVKEYAVSQYPRGNVIGYTIRNGRYRYTEWIENYKSYDVYDVTKVVARELYDYEKDPQEKISQAANPAYSSVVNELSGALVKHLTQQYQISQKHPGVATHYYAKRK